MLVDRLAAEPGSEVKFSRVLLFADGDETKIGTPGIDGLEISAKVISHPRGPRIEVLRYKSKKRVRVHRGGRADLTAIEILPFGGKKKAVKAEADEHEEEAEAKPKRATAARKPRAAKPVKKTEATEATEV